MIARKQLSSHPFFPNSEAEPYPGASFEQHNSNIYIVINVVYFRRMYEIDGLTSDTIVKILP
jgi:hypothetical protein